MRRSSVAGLVSAVALMLITAACVATETRSATPGAATQPVASPASSPGTAGNTATGPGTPEARPPIASPAPGAGSPVAQPAASPRPVGTPAPAPSPIAAGTFGFGRAATTDDIRRIDIDVRGSDGAGLPAGGGTSAEGKAVYAAKCAACHGADGEGTAIGAKLIDSTPFKAGAVTATVGNYWPYAPTLYDYINRAMPFNAPGSLKPDEVYQLTAYLLAANKLIGENDRMDAQNLPRVQMPNRPNFTSPDPRPDTP